MIITTTTTIIIIIIIIPTNEHARLQQISLFVSLSLPDLMSEGAQSWQVNYKVLVSIFDLWLPRDKLKLSRLSNEATRAAAFSLLAPLLSGDVRSAVRATGSAAAGKQSALSLGVGRQL